MSIFLSVRPAATLRIRNKIEYAANDAQYLTQVEQMDHR